VGVSLWTGCHALPGSLYSGSEVPVAESAPCHRIAHRMTLSQGASDSGEKLSTLLLVSSPEHPPVA
jgi:hypothetical protein